MLQILKRIILYIYLLLVRSSKRKSLLEKLAPGYKKRALDIAEIPVVLDELKQLPKEFSVETSLTAFDSHGLCISFKSRKSQEGLRCIQLDLDIPGYGYFCHNELVSDCPVTGRTSLICLDPMRRWQVQFKGLLRHVNADGKNVSASIFLYWQCLFDPYDILLSPSCWSLSGTLAGLSWRTILKSTPVLDNGIFYNQWGELRGRIRIEGREELNVKLKSVRQREIKNIATHTFNDVVQQHFILEQSGLSFSQQAVKLVSESIYLGRVTFPIADSSPSTLDHFRGSVVDKPSTLLKFPQQIKTCANLYTVNETSIRQCFGHPVIGFAFKTLMINGQNGFGIEINKTSQTLSENDRHLSIPVPKLFEISTKNTSSNENIVSLDNVSSMSRSLVGGKAYYLGCVKSLGHFNVPKGLVITTKAFENHIMKTSSLTEASKKIKNCLTDDILQALKQHCEQAVNAVKETVISEKLGADLEGHLAMVFGNDWCKKHYAVRSSGVGEDSVQTSAAGQLETYLCVKGLDNIISAVRDCWASTFAYRVVEYRRQNGQELLESVGVIIQETVNSEVSGVVFTIDPVDNEASKLVITANYGLGESVVSGDVDADTIVVDRHDENNLLINKVQKGNKESKSIISVEEVKIVETSETERNALCMEDKQIMLLSKQAIDLENAFGTYLDIEWAVEDGSLFILQVRPVTSLYLATDDDLIHEFDSPLANDNVLITKSNVQEMMPNALPTLTCDLFVRAVDKSCTYLSCSRIGVSHPAYAICSVPNYCGYVFLNLTHATTRPITCFGDGAKTDFELNIVGQVVEEHPIHTVKDFIGRPITVWQRIMANIRVFITLKRHDSSLFENLRKQLESFEIGRDTDDSKSLYRYIDNSLIFYFEMWRAYLFKASESVVPASVALMFLKKEANNISVKALADMALILSDCGNVESAEVPHAINDLAERIAKSNVKQEFLAKPLADSDTFLRNSVSEDFNTAYVRFMEKHGHRGILEADLMEKSWSQDPKKLIESLKQIIIKGTMKRKEKQIKTIPDIVNGLQSNLNWLQKLLLRRFMVKSAKDGVAGRELGKALMIKTTEVFKVAYWRLAELMVMESRLPEQELLFFLTHREIGELIESRSASLIRLAKRRKRIFPDMKRFMFPKFSSGYPELIQTEERELDSPASFTLHGMPVCRGKVDGRACVIKTIEDVSNLKIGDVMICKYTDVGWSPYFPMISGLVTEVGSFVSHGAVVARECGIPCIVSTANATDMICTGDRVVVDGTAGTVSKL